MISPQAPDIKICASKEALAQEVADLVKLRIELELKAKGHFHLALTGGSLGILISQLLVEQWNDEPERFIGLHLWWSDERFVSELSPERNARPVLMGLSDDSPIHIHEVMSADSSVDVEVAAKRYSADLFGIGIDLAILGVGPDGHVASLFPETWEEAEVRSAIAVLNSPKPPSQRISFSMAKINSSKSVWLVLSGGEKHEAIERIIARDASIPASYVHGQVETLLFADRSALSSE